MTLDLLLAVAALVVALALRPWRAARAEGPPWAWLAWWSAMPLFWGTDRYVAMAVVQPLSGAVLLMLLTGWPMAVLAMVPVAVATALMAGLDTAEALHRLVWLGIVPATLALGLGAAVRRWLPHHLFVYILGRGFVVTALSLVLSGALSMWLHGGTAGLDPGEQMIGRWLAAWGDAFLTGMVVAVFVAFRPEWLATYSDQIYLPDDRTDPRS
ncbi:hypothetical protein [uncultured Sphaerotilus sp.]|uniref:hypothetical protein n=1 Tax=uncultured Sphaerotilus sp. TaxID=474984 RepID=UPI0030CA1302